MNYLQNSAMMLVPTIYQPIRGGVGILFRRRSSNVWGNCSQRFIRRATDSNTLEWQTQLLMSCCGGASCVWPRGGRGLQIRASLLNTNWRDEKQCFHCRLAKHTAEKKHLIEAQKMYQNMRFFWNCSVSVYFHHSNFCNFVVNGSGAIDLNMKS